MRRFHPRDRFIIVALREQCDDPMWFRRRPLSTPLGFIAIVVGWITTRMGQQPYVV